MSTQPPAAPAAFVPVATVADLLAAAARAGLRLHTSAADFDKTGLDFLVVHAHDEDGVPWIVRAPRRGDVVASIAVEARILALVAPHLPVAVPAWRLATADVVAYPRLGGVPAVTVEAERGPTWNRLDPAAPSEAFLASFAAALAALQRISDEDAARAGVPTTTMSVVRADLARHADETRAVLAPSDATWARWQRWLADDAAWPTHTALVHGDLHPGHMLLDDDGALSGILDWTEAKVSDPSVDLAMFYGCFGAAALDALLIRFAAAGGRTWPYLARHAAERWAAFPILVAEWGLRTGNDAVLDHARAQLKAS